MTGDVREILDRYLKGKEYVSLLPPKKFALCGWGALGDLTKMGALIDSLNDRKSEDLVYLVRLNRGHVGDMYPGLEVLTQEPESFENVRTYLELSLIFNSDRILYLPKFREDSLFIPEYRLYSYTSDYDMQHSIACVPSNLGYSHAYGKESDGRYEGSVLLIPKAGWTFTGNDAYKESICKMLSEISSRLVSQGIKVYANSAEPFGDAEPLYLSPEEMSVHVRDFAHIIGPMTGLVDFLILSDCRSLSLIYGNTSQFNWYNVDDLAAPEQEIFKHDLSVEGFDEILEKVLDRCVCAAKKA